MAKSGSASRLRVDGNNGAAGVRGAGGSADTRKALIEAAIETLKTDGFSGASARAIAGRAGCNQGLVFYYFGSVANLLLAALDAVSADRLARYGAAVERAESADELVEMIAGASSTPGLGPEVLVRIAPWTEFAQRAVDDVIGASPLAPLVPSEE